MPGDPESVEITFEKLTTAMRFPTLRVEIWPARLQGDVMRFGAAPIAVSEMPLTWTHAAVTFEVPRLRDPVATWTFVVGVQADGARTVVAERDDLGPTPPWRGTLIDWWTGKP